MWDIPSANGSTRTATAATTCSEVETRHIKGPRAYDATGLPLHRDNQTVVKERIYLDKANPNLLRNEITVIDNALTRPWVVTKTYRRNPRSRPGGGICCAESNNHVRISGEGYFLSADGYLMPGRRISRRQTCAISTERRSDRRRGHAKRSSSGSIALAAALWIGVSSAQAFEETKYSRPEGPVDASAPRAGPIRARPR
jgi:hypothetical protein